MGRSFGDGLPSCTADRASGEQGSRVPRVQELPPAPQPCHARCAALGKHTSVPFLQISDQTPCCQGDHTAPPWDLTRSAGPLLPSTPTGVHLADQGCQHLRKVVLSLLSPVIQEGAVEQGGEGEWAPAHPTRAGRPVASYEQWQSRRKEGLSFAALSRLAGAFRGESASTWRGPWPLGAGPSEVPAAPAGCWCDCCN